MVKWLFWIAGAILNTGYQIWLHTAWFPAHDKPPPYGVSFVWSIACMVPTVTGTVLLINDPKRKPWSAKTAVLAFALLITVMWAIRLWQAAPWVPDDEWSPPSPALEILWSVILSVWSTVGGVVLGVSVADTAKRKTQTKIA